MREDDIVRGKSR